MNAASRVKWVGVGLVTAAVIGARVLSGGAAEAAPLHPRELPTPRVATARDASAAPGITLAGFTSQHLPSFFKVTGDGRSLTVASMALRMNCTSGAQFILADVFGQVPIGPSGRLHASFSSPTIVSNGGTYSGKDSLRGRLDRKHSELIGVWKLSVNYTFSDGTSDACDSGPVRFTATNH